MAGAHSSQQVERQGPTGAGEDHRHGTVTTAFAHIVTAVVGAGVLVLPYSLASLGWLVGIASLTALYILTTLNACLLSSAADRNGVRYPSYVALVSAVLGHRAEIAIGALQYTINSFAAVAYTVGAAQCARAVRKLLGGCGDAGNCVNADLWPELAAFGAVQVLASQMPSLDATWWSSILGALTSFIYSFCAFGLSVAHALRRTRSGVSNPPAQSTHEPSPYLALQALGAFAFAFAFPTVLVEVQDTLRTPPSPGSTMRRAIHASLGTAFLLYLAVAVSGWLAFGAGVPENVLTAPGVGPRWVILLANASVVLHLFSAYQVYVQPVFAAMEQGIARGLSLHHDQYLPLSSKEEGGCGSAPSMPLAPRVALRSMFVVAVTGSAIAMPFFADIIGLIGAFLFWPAGILFPVMLYLRVAQPRRWPRAALIAMCAGLLLLAIGIVVGSVHGLVSKLMA